LERHTDRTQGDEDGEWRGHARRQRLLAEVLRVVVPNLGDADRLEADPADDGRAVVADLPHAPHTAPALDARPGYKRSAELPLGVATGREHRHCLDLRERDPGAARRQDLRLDVEVLVLVLLVVGRRLGEIHAGNCTRSASRHDLRTPPCSARAAALGRGV
jgi:hypothetical protein